jgi:hypothetical protein
MSKNKSKSVLVYIHLNKLSKFKQKVKEKEPEEPKEIKNCEKKFLVRKQLYNQHQRERQVNSSSSLVPPKNLQRAHGKMLIRYQSVLKS